MNDDEGLFFPLEESALFTIDEAEEKLTKQFIWFPDYERIDAVACEVVNYCVLSIKYLPLGRVLNQECCLLVVKFRTRDEKGKPSEQRRT
jgi:hypothetical protein